MTKKDFFAKIKRPILFGNLLAMCLTGIGLIYGTLWYLDKYTNHGIEITVPDIHGLQAESATLRLQSCGLDGVVSDSGYVRNLSAGAVLEQSVAAGQKVKSGRIIYLTVNSGYQPTIAIPDLADNSSVREAQTRLTAIGFKLAPIEYIDGERDWVYEVRCQGRPVNAGTRIPVETAITLVVGNGATGDDLWGLDSTYTEGAAYDDESGLPESDKENQHTTPEEP